MEKQHTPTPWQYQSSNIRTVEPCKNSWKGRIVDLGNEPYADEQAVANRDYMLKAVNAHDEMVWSLRDIATGVYPDGEVMDANAMQKIASNTLLKIGEIG